MSKFDFRQKALSQTAAHQILSNVFHQCDMESNSVPLESIMDYSNYRRQRSLFEQSIIYFVLILFMLLPILFITGTLVWSFDSSGATYTFSADSPIPAESISASMGNHAVPASLLDDGSFLLSPNRNGEMHVTITLKNQQELSATINVTDVDDVLPAFSGLHLENGFFYLSVSDEGSGINADKITVADETGIPVQGWRFDAESSRVIIPYTESTILVNVPDMNNNVLRLQFAGQP